MHTNNDLSERELEILRLVATGASNKQIAQQLVISTNTVKVHLKNIFSKIGAASRTEAAMFAVQRGIIASGESIGERSGTEAGTSPGDWLSLPRVDSKGPSIRPIRIILLGVIAVIFLSVFGYLVGRNNANPIPATVSSVSQGPGTEPRAEWKAMASMPTARWGMAICTFGGEIFAIGGEGEQGVVSSNERYNPQTNLWTAIKPKPVPVADIQGVLINGKIYIPGGREFPGSVTPILEIYDPRTDLWETGSSMPIALSAYSSVSFEGRLYVFGGWDGRRYLDTVFSYDPESDEWEQKTSMMTARGFTGATIANGKIYVLGGYDGQQALNVNESYQPNLDGVENPWMVGSRLPFGLYGMGLVSAADIIHLVGGQTADSPENTSLIYFPQNDEWSQFDTTPSSLPRTNLGMAFLDRNIYVIGGLSGNEASGLTQSYQVIYSVAIPMIR